MRGVILLIERKAACKNNGLVLLHGAHSIFLMLIPQTNIESSNTLGTLRIYFEESIIASRNYLSSGQKDYLEIIFY